MAVVERDGVTGWTSSDPAAPVIAKVATSTKFETASGTSDTSAGSLAPENVFYLSYKVFLEGVEVPVSGIQIEYGVNGVPQCNITLPASKLLRDLPPTTKVAVFFQDLVPESDGTFKWRLLFDGEFMGYGYAVNGSGESMSLSFMHNAAHMHSMQLMIMDMSEYWIGGGDQYAAGDSTLVSPQHWNRPEKTILAGLLNKDAASNYKTMADICYTLVRTVLADVKTTASGAYFKMKFGDTAKDGLGGYKLLRRFYGISSEATSMAIPESGNIAKDPVGGGGNGSLPPWNGGKNPYNPVPGDSSNTVGSNPTNIGADRSADTAAKAKALNNTDFSKSTNREGNNCSSFVSTAAGITPELPDAGDLAKYVASNGTLFTDIEALKPGDIIFIKNSAGSWPDGTITHVGVYQGGGTWTECRGSTVTTGPISTNYGGDASNNYNGYVFYYGRLKK